MEPWEGPLMELQEAQIPEVVEVVAVNRHLSMVLQAVPASW